VSSSIFSYPHYLICSLPCYRLILSLYLSYHLLIPVINLYSSPLSPYIPLYLLISLTLYLLTPSSTYVHYVLSTYIPHPLSTPIPHHLLLSLSIYSYPSPFTHISHPLSTHIPQHLLISLSKYSNPSPLLILSIYLYPMHSIYIKHRLLISLTLISIIFTLVYLYTSCSTHSYSLSYLFLTMSSINPLPPIINSSTLPLLISLLSYTNLLILSLYPLYVTGLTLSISTNFYEYLLLNLFPLLSYSSFSLILDFYTCFSLSSHFVFLYFPLFLLFIPSFPFFFTFISIFLPPYFSILLPFFTNSFDHLYPSSSIYLYPSLSICLYPLPSIY
jgi:hypothetical protein